MRTPKEFVEKEKSVEYGDTKTEIIYKVGIPKNTQQNADIEVWQYYCVNNVLATRPYHYLVVWFQNNKVFRTTTYESYSTSDFRSINGDKSKNEAYSGRVYVCGGDYGEKFHSRDNCPGLNNCQGSIYYYSSQQEGLNNGYEYCEICWK